jgi:hypothetical protein
MSAVADEARGVHPPRGMTITPPPEGDVPEERPPAIDTPDDPIPDRPSEPGLRAPGAEDPPMRLPRDNPDVETEL